MNFKFSKKLIGAFITVLLLTLAVSSFASTPAGAGTTPTPTCTPTPTPTVTPTVTPTPTPRPYHYACDSDKVCSKVEGDGEDRCDTSDDCKQEVTPTPSVTPTPTPTPTTTPSNPGGPGDGKSDNLGCGSHDCSSHPSAPQGQVLGLSTTSGEENYLLQIVQALGALTSAGLGLAFFKK